MATLEIRVQAAATRNKELHDIIAETEYAPAALKRKAEKITDLMNDIRNARARVDRLDIQRKEELKDVEKYRDSTVRRIAFSVTGKKAKYEERAEKEEKEYHDVLQKQHLAREEKKALEQKLFEARKVRDELQVDADRNKQAHKDLDALYDTVFQWAAGPGGPNAEEKASSEALQEYHDASLRTEQQKHAHRFLKDAQIEMRNAEQSMAVALAEAGFDLATASRPMGYRERAALQDVNSRLLLMRMLVAEARLLDPGIRPLPDPIVPMSGGLMDYRNDSLAANMAADSRIYHMLRSAQRDLESCATALNRELESVRNRHLERMDSSDEMAQKLEDTQLALRKAREALFERIAAQEPSIDALISDNKDGKEL
ncbi:hypothetical protein GQ53DRAFT_430340 [Thozetella sp. PMI_491]|nr:hypothetical protein GQ53DRAFT_430340 [Thozetella sp. PMI_491]